MKKYILIFVAIAGLTACEKKHDLDYFQKNTDARDTKLAECKTQPGALDNDKECIAAYLADEVKSVAYFKVNTIERKLRINECKDHVGTIGNSNNCQNANSAGLAVIGGGKPVYVNGR